MGIEEMICPHCKKLIEYGLDRKGRVRADTLRAMGHSLRDIEFILRTEGFRISFSSLGKHFRKQKK